MLTSPDAKRQKVDPSQASFFYPDIPREVQNDGHDKGAVQVARRAVEKTNSTAWGKSEVARNIALLIEVVSDANEKLLRTHHPSLSCASSVWIVELADGERTWNISGVESNPPHTRVGGVEVHVLPDFSLQRAKSSIIPAMRRNDFFGDQVINPRRILTPNQLDLLRLNFPRACGAQILITRFLIVLYREADELRMDQAGGILSTTGGMQVIYRLLECQPTSELSAGAAVEGQDCQGIACVGLRLKLRGCPTSVITTVTHAFVPVQGLLNGASSTLTRAVNTTASWAVTALRKVRPGSETWTPPFVRIDQRPTIGASPIGKEVVLSTDKRRIGSIRSTYDQPSSILPYPAGYRCDLSLITDPQLPHLGTSSEQLAIIGWADLKDVLAGAELSATAFQVKESRWETMHGKAFNTAFLPSLLEGMQYFWTREYLQQNIAFLWRTVGNKSNISCATGYSGTVLCTGDKRRARAVVFQNFQQPWIKDLKDDISEMYVKGGFLLPPEILQSTIECPSVSSAPIGSTLPKNSRSSSEISSGRSVSGNV